MTTNTIASVAHHHNHKASSHQHQHQHQHHHDEETTAYSSWIDDEDGNSQLSSCLSHVEDLHDDHVTEEDEEFRKGSVILVSSPECALLVLDNVDDIYHSTMNNRMAAFQELTERASHFLQRESSQDYAVEDYFQRSYYDKTASRSLDHKDDACESAANKFINEIQYLTLSSDSSTRRKSTPIDKSCRLKMMEWSYRVIEFSFPPPAPPPASKHHEQESRDSSTSQDPSSSCSKTSTRQHSIEALQIIFTTFSYLDRLCTKFKVVDRDEYKLLSMVCLHLAAKSSGLFASDTEEECYDYFNHQHNDAMTHRCQHFSEDSAATSPSSSSSRDSSAPKECEYTGQTILSTPDDDDVVTSQQPQRRPPMNLISLAGLHSLCNGLFTMEQFCEMEYIILHRGLDWRLNSVQAMDWVDLSLELATLLQLGGNRCLTKDDCHDIRETILVQLEYAVEISSFIGCASSLLAIAAFLNAVEGCSDVGDCDCILDCIEEVFGLNFDKSELDKVRYMMRSQLDEAEYTSILEEETCKPTR